MRDWRWACYCSLRVFLPALLCLCVLVCGCGRNPGGQAGSEGTAGPAALRIVAGSENKTLEPIIQRFAQQKGQNIQVEYLGSVDIMLQLENGAGGYDAVWPANSIWIDLGDKQKLVKYQASIMRSPVVFGVKKSVAKRLGWIGRKVRVNDVLQAAESGKLKFMMTSATQSNSGAAAYLGFLYAFAGSPEMLTAQHLSDPNMRGKVKRLLNTVNRSSGSSGWLKELFLQRYESFDAMVNYECIIIEANQALISRGKEPLYVIYLVDGLAIADSPLGYLNHGDASKEALFKELQAYLLSSAVQKEILGLGRRTGLVGLDVSGADKRVFNPDWGIDPALVITPIRYPQPEVMRQALSLYQTAFRKPSLTVYCLDFSGSMAESGAADLKAAMRTLLDQRMAAQYMLQGTPGDITVVIPFEGRPRAMWTVRGCEPSKLSPLLSQIENSQANGSTDIYTPVMNGLDFVKTIPNLGNYFPAVILMTDGNSNTGANYDALVSHYRKLNLSADVPVFAVLFGSASESQLKQITSFTSGAVFDGRKDLVEAFRKAKGYN